MRCTGVGKNRRQQCSVLVGKVSALSLDPGLQRGGIDPGIQHSGVIVAFDQCRIAAGQGRHNAFGQHAHVGGNAEFPSPRFHEIAHAAGAVVRRAKAGHMKISHRLIAQSFIRHRRWGQLPHRLCTGKRNIHRHAVPPTEHRESRNVVAVLMGDKDRTHLLQILPQHRRRPL